MHVSVSGMGTSTNLREHENVEGVLYKVQLGHRSPRPIRYYHHHYSIDT
jgi:hypothetical protein